jgi:hypothetical protein
VPVSRSALIDLATAYSQAWADRDTVHATLSGALSVGAQTIAGAGHEVSFEGVDIVRASNGQ